MTSPEPIEKVLEQKNRLDLRDRIKELTNSNVLVSIEHGHPSLLEDLIPETQKRKLIFKFNGREFDVLEYLADLPKSSKSTVYAIFKIIVSDDDYTAVLRYVLPVNNPNYKR